jgi:transposase
MAGDLKPRRRHYGAEFKAQVLAECAVPGASVAQVARAHGINDNIVYGWRKLAEQRDRQAPSASGAASAAGRFIPLALPASVAAGACAPSIELELRRSALNVHIRWPLSAAADLGTWLREVLS